MTQENATWAQLRRRVKWFRAKLPPRQKDEPEQLRRLYRGLDILLRQIELAAAVHGWNVPAVGEIAERLAAHGRSEQEQELEASAYENDPKYPPRPTRKKLKKVSSDCPDPLQTNPLGDRGRPKSGFPDGPDLRSVTNPPL
jgi:hypothetical protein